MTAIKQRIGFMQGRLSPLIDGRIQAFPWPYWEQELLSAASIGLPLLEWTLDHERIMENPLMTPSGRALIRRLKLESIIEIPSLTADFCMQAPFWKARGDAQINLFATFENVLQCCADAGIKIIVVPLVDHGALTNTEDRLVLEKKLMSLTSVLARQDQMIAFESDFAPAKLKSFIDGFPASRFAINYDIGNSASLGWDPEEEITLLAPYIVNVHVKDRLRGGTTVPLGQGAADLPKVFSLLGKSNYRGNYILQTARATEGNHQDTLCSYRDIVIELIERTHGS